MFGLMSDETGGKAHALTVYLGSAGAARRAYYAAAMDLGIALTDRGIRLVYGGMNSGTMGALADAMLERGGQVTGVIPSRVKDSDRQHKGLTETVFVPDLWERKQSLFHRGDAIVVLPGGYGTIDEALEVLYWAALGLHRKKLIFVNVRNFWTPFLDFLHTIEDLPPGSFSVVPRPVEIFERLAPVWDGAAGDNAAAAIVAAKEEKAGTSAVLPYFEGEILCGTGLPILLDAPKIADVSRFVSALTLKQLGKHVRPMGVLNRAGAFDGLLKWIRKAAHEGFLTAKCPLLLSAARSEKGLMEKLESQGPVMIDLNREKWGGAG